MYNFVHSELPPPLMTLFTQNTDIHGHKMRQSHNPHVEHRQNKNISKTFHQGPKLWNELPMSTKSVNWIQVFKSRLKLDSRVKESFETKPHGALLNYVSSNIYNQLIVCV